MSDVDVRDADSLSSGDSSRTSTPFAFEREWGLGTRMIYRRYAEVNQLALAYRPLATGWKRFKYRSLHPLKRQIRLLRLESGWPDHPLQGTLARVSLGVETCYDALSYMWGDPTPVDVVYISQRAVPIAENLACALRHLRRKDEALVIWVDAICINQRDNAERGHQVSMMRSVYQQARVVRVWVNIGFNPLDPAMMKLAAFDREVPDTRAFLMEEVEFWRPLKPIFWNNYWSRIWVQQEVINATRLQLHTPKLIVGHKSFMHFQSILGAALAECYDDTLTPDPDRMRWRGEVTSIAPHSFPAKRLTEYMRGTEPVYTLLALLVGSSSLTVTDERDRVYGLMHLASDYTEGSILVNYTQDLTHNLLSALSFHIRTHSTLDFLVKARLQHSMRPGHERPTWMPDWSQWQVGVALRSDYSATANTVSQYEPISKDGKVLRVRGFSISRLDHTSLALPFRDDSTIEEVWHMLSRVTGAADVATVERTVLQDLIHIITGSDARACGDAEWNHTVAAIEHVHLLALSHHRSRRIGYCGEGIADLLDDLQSVVRQALISILEMESESICRTTTGNLVMLPCADVLDCDEVWLLFGCHMPIVLRPTGLIDTFNVVCSAYVPDFMEGEMMEGLAQPTMDGHCGGQWQVRTIDLI